MHDYARQENGMKEEVRLGGRYVLPRHDEFCFRWGENQDSARWQYSAISAASKLKNGSRGAQTTASATCRRSNTFTGRLCCKTAFGNIFSTFNVDQKHSGLSMDPLRCSAESRKMIIQAVASCRQAIF